MNVMVVIHQPRYSIFTMFDTVLLLGLGGQTVYLGPVDKAEAYFNMLGFVPPLNENRAGMVTALHAKARAAHLKSLLLCCSGSWVSRDIAQRA